MMWSGGLRRRFGVSKPERARSMCMEKIRVRLTKKFANMIDGVDLSRYMVGQTLKVTPAEARVLTAEGWAEPVEPRTRRESAEPTVFQPTEVF
jgi:hypothetical protein